MPRFHAHLPHAEIGLTPDLTHQVGCLRQAACCLDIQSVAALNVPVHGVEKVTVDVQLELFRCGVPYPNRRRSPVALEGKRYFWRAVAPVQPVQDLHTWPRQLCCMEEPPEERIYLGMAAEAEQRIERERCVADPTESVVPVALSADVLGE